MEYEQLGSWLFWNTYGDTIRYLDGNIIAPSLRTLGIVVNEADKWPLTANTYSFFLDYRECEFIFDAPYGGAPLEILLRRYGDTHAKDIGKLAVESGIPISPVKQNALKKSLNKLLEIARR
ncbi:MAG: hypothetical protein U1A23_03045 [Candidatus Sungbacteria bacterium]|nr:hypothetical protein [bacterium]MDZ4285879.1 hypothetical protein [Candidatus Sungbacteria bacterium]